MRHSYRFLLKLREPRAVFLSGFGVGVLLVMTLATTVFEPTQGNASLHPSRVGVDPNLSSTAGIAETRLSLRVLRRKVPAPNSVPSGQEDSSNRRLSLLVSRVDTGQTVANSSKQNAEELTPDDPISFQENGGSQPRPLLQVDPIHWQTDSASITLTGTDPSAPRRLTLWRKQGNDIARLSLGQSDAMGEFHFAQVIVPLKGFELLVTGNDFRNPLSDPDVVSLYLKPPLPPPSLTTRGDAIDGTYVQLHPALDEGVLLISSKADGVIDRITIEAQPTGLAAGIELSDATRAFMDQDSECEGYQVVQELEDGRVSRALALPCALLNL